MKIREITDHLENWAPLSYQESYDNSGLIIGDPLTELKNILITLDVTEEVIEEAKQKNCNLIISHHPLIFNGIKTITGSHWVERCIISAIKNDIAIYAIHTNLDNVISGVNAKIAEKLGLVNIQVLAPKPNQLLKLVTFIPNENVAEVLGALYQSGAGKVGNYAHCSFQVGGTGTFKPGQGTDPYIGKQDHNESVSETRVEVILPVLLKDKVLQALKKAHPYEEVAYYFNELVNANQEVGAGMIGKLTKPMKTEDFLKHLKKTMDCKMIRHTKLVKDSIKKVALCGGSGSFLLEKAKSVHADIFITGDFKYHDFFEAENRIIIADIGHYESEVFTKDLLYDRLRENFTNIALHLSEMVTNPINYL